MRHLATPEVQTILQVVERAMRDRVALPVAVELERSEALFGARDNKKRAQDALKRGRDKMAAMMRGTAARQLRSYRRIGRIQRKFKSWQEVVT